MTRPVTQRPPTPLCLEMHSAEPERLVAFYEHMLNITFTKTTYPFPRYIADFGRFALIVADCRGHEADTESEPGTSTLVLLSSPLAAEDARPYFLFPRRLVAGTIPGRHAARLRDPDGNYLALASSMDSVLGRQPPISSWHELIDCVTEFGLMLLRRYRTSARLRVDGLRDAYEYANNRVAIESRSLDGFTHLVASREGLLAINQTSFRRLARGRFYGLTVKDGDIYCFQSCGTSESPERRAGKGRVVRFGAKTGRIREAEVLIRDLDDGCHQIDFVGETLLIVDCYNGRLLKVAPGSATYEAVYPLGQLSRESASTDSHMNSIAAHPDGTYWLLLHNYTKKPSEVAVLNSSFELIRRFEISAGCAHNIVFTGDGLQYLIADSYGGRIISARGPVVDGDMLMPRGVSLDETTCVFGESFLATRGFRRYVPGRVHFVDRTSWKRSATLGLPAAPTEIRRIDGQDFSLSNFTLANRAGGHPEETRAERGVTEGSLSIQSLH